MLRRFTQTLGRYKQGTLHDWPGPTWQKIAQEAGKPLDEISKLEEIDQVLARRPLIGGQKLRPRGSAAAAAGGR